MTLPQHALLELTYNCNHACPFCSCEWLTHPGLYRQEIDISEWKELVRTYAAHGVTEFTFTGGEPLLKHGIGELIDFAGTLPQELKLNIFTNGTLLNDEILSTLKRNNVFLATSIHSVKNQPYFTGASTTFAQTLDNVAKAVKYGLKTSVSMTITTKNFKEIANLGVAVLLAGADVFQIGAVMAAGRCLYHPELMLSPEQLKKLPILAGRLQKRFPNKKVYYVVEPECKCSCYREDDGKIFLTYNDQCPAMKDYFTVGPSGWVRSCLHLPKDLFYWSNYEHFYDIRPLS